MAKCDKELNSTKMFQEAGVIYIPSIHCDLKAGHPGLHQYGWAYKWGEEWARGEK